MGTKFKTSERLQRTWHDGPPPHIGWWNASTDRDNKAWRWWSGTAWSVVAYADMPATEAARRANTKKLGFEQVIWTNYWPENARVPRVDPGNLNSKVNIR